MLLFSESCITPYNYSQSIYTPIILTPSENSDPKSSLPQLNAIYMLATLNKPSSQQ